MQKRHFNPEQYFKEQSYTAEKYIIPYINKAIELSKGLSIAEIGCGIGGNLEPFMNLGCKIIGIDKDIKSIKIAELIYKEHPNRNNLKLIHSDIYDIHACELSRFDLIFLKDTLEHIHDHERFLKHIKNFLADNGKLFISFPPWKMPFGGHQQICDNILLKNTPYFHILPKKIYKSVLKIFGERKGSINSLLEIKGTRINIHKFNKYIKKQNLTVVKKTLYLLNPNYKIKFGISPKKLPILMNIPYLRDFFVTTCYYILGREDE